MRKIALFTLAGALALSACGKKDETESVTNNLVEPPVENVIVNEPDATPPPPPVSNNVAAPAAPAPTVSEQQQIQDDAEATGMTSRLRQSSDDSGAGSDEAGNSGG